jgi:PPE-repeat protein
MTNSSGGTVVRRVEGGSHTTSVPQSNTHSTVIRRAGGENLPQATFSKSTYEEPYGQSNIFPPEKPKDSGNRHLSIIQEERESIGPHGSNVTGLQSGFTRPVATNSFYNNSTGIQSIPSRKKFLG